MSQLFVPNTTQIPNVVIDVFAPKMDPAAKDVLYYIYRRTLGFQRFSDKISLSQMTKGLFDKSGERLDFGTGHSRSTNVRAIKALLKLGLIFVIKTRAGSVFRPNLNPDIELVKAKLKIMDINLNNIINQPKLI